MLHWGIYSIPAFNPFRKTKKGIYNGRFFLFSFFFLSFFPTLFPPFFKKLSEWYLQRLKNTFLYGKATQQYHKKNYGKKEYHLFLEDFEKATQVGYNKQQGKRYNNSWLTLLFVCLFFQKEWRPEPWVELFKKCGAEYVIITAKHHDGVALYPSEVGTYSTSRFLKREEESERERKRARKRDEESQKYDNTRTE